jgi:MFS family permease
MTTVFILLTAISYVPLAFLPPVAVMVLPAFLLGLAWGPLEPLLNSLVQDRFPEDQHGRVYGVQLAIFYAAPPLGQLGAGVAAERYGEQPALFAVATGLLLMAVTVRFVPTLRGLDLVEQRS